MSDNKWTEIITPERGWLSLKLGELWRYRDLVEIFVKRDLTAVYKQTVLGPLWFLVSPVLTVAVYALVFGGVAGIGTDGIPKILFYLSGIVLWNYFATCLTSTSNTFVNNRNIFGKVYFPRLAVPFSIIISNLVKFGIQFSLFLVVLLYYVVFKQYNPNIDMHILIFPLILITLAVLGLSAGIIISALTTKYRDFTFMVAVGVNLLMFASPVIIPASQIPPSFQKYLFLNPVAPLIEGFRYCFLGAGTFSVTGILISTGVSFVMLFIGLVIFNKVEQNFMDTV